MRPYAHHFLVCLTNRPAFGQPSCGARGSTELLARLQRSLDRKKLTERGLCIATGSTCLGLCEDGPNVVVYPEGTWYRGVAPEDVQELVETHAVEGRVIERLKNPDIQGVPGPPEGP